mgnify:CR=1 FL=1
MNESIRRNVADAFVVVSAQKNRNRIRLRDKKSAIFIRNRTK